MPDLSRREILTAGAAAALTPFPATTISLGMKSADSFVDILRQPDVLLAFGLEDAPVEAQIAYQNGRLTLQGNGVSRIQLRWRAGQRTIKHYLGDHWERSYADLSWQGESPNRIMPWYFLASDGHTTHGYGVKTGAGAMCFWMADSEGISLWADVRSGGSPVELNGRTLDVAQIVTHQGRGESAFEAAKAFCKAMCPNPLLPDKPVYGTNDWNFAYGNNSAELIAGVAGLVSELSANVDNRPYAVIDEGWAMGPFNGNFGHGPWEGNPRFGDMGAFAHRLKALSVRPGIWFRPLTPLPDTPESWRLSRDKSFLDPTIPEVKDHIAKEIKKFGEWGYEMIKHDFTTWDFCGRWGFQMGPNPTHDGWKPNDPTKTTAEIFTDLYKTIRSAAGEVRLIGCNTVGHLAAGYHELQRIGDDTSGRSWNRNRRMGVNTLAFRAAQHRSFFEIDPDIVSITKVVPWSLVDQWLTLVSESGASLFVAIDPAITEPKHKEALKKAFDLASKPQPIGEPLDWFETLCPRRWKLLGKDLDFAWMGDTGAWPFPD